MHLNSPKELLLIFTRNPELGKCKTRLAATIGDRAALDIYCFLLEHTRTITQNLNADKFVYYSETIGENDIWTEDYYEKKLQVGDDLGQRMFNAFDKGFKKGYDRIIIIGSDMYDIDQHDLMHAFAQLKTNDFVIGPASDGGYYLLGAKKMNKNLFLNKAWGTPTVLKATLRDLENENFEQLDIKNDVDLYDDIKDHEAFQPFLKHLKP